MLKGVIGNIAVALGLVVLNPQIALWLVNL
ncbi:MAG: hypothetical protein ACI8ZB_001980 [Desulforhopalus sp.]|jgi:hypothetical protein